MLNNELMHHGVRGMKWGVRRYQNKDGSLTPEGKRRQVKYVSKSGAVTLAKGTELYRVSSGSKTDIKKGHKLYTTPDEQEHEKYKTMLGATNMLKSGKAFVHKYVAEQDIRIPSIKQQTKIERKLLNDPKAKKEVIESLMSKGCSREEATYRANISAGKEFLKASPALLLAPVFPLVGTIPFEMASNARKQKLSDIRVSIGDKNNKTLNENFERALSNKGYNAYRDTNDRSKNIARNSIVVINPDKNAKLKSARQLDKKEFAKAYVDNKINRYKKTNRALLKNLDRDDLLKDGEKAYDQLKKQYVLNKHNAAAQEEILKKFKEELK